MNPQTSLTSRPGLREGQRQVVIRACDMCRKKKIRCEPTKRGCAQCSKGGTGCHFTPIALKRKPRRPAGFRYIAQLEERLSEVQGLLKDQSPRESAASNNHNPDQQQTMSAADLDVSFDKAALRIQSTDGAPWLPTSDSQVSLFGQTNTLDFDLGATFGTYDRKGFDLPALDSQVVDRLTRSVSSNGAPPLRAFFPTRSQQALPTKAVALELVQETFRNYNTYLPLFDEEDFLEEFHLKYSTSDSADASWWACLNVVLSIAHRLRSLRSLDPTHHNTLASGYIQNALSVVTELSVSSRSLSAVRGLVGMACILQGTSNPEPASMLVAAALRLAQAMDLHREKRDSNLTEAEAEKRRRVFWKIYILDKDISLRTGRPFGQDDEDMDVQLPSSTDRDEPRSMDIFKHRIGLAVIQGQVYKQLYSVRAERLTDAQRAMAAEDLSSLLSYWRSSAELLESSEIESTVSSLRGQQLSGEMIHRVVLRLTYIHCLAMIDRHLPPMVQGLPSDQELRRPELLTSPGNLYLSEARKAFHLFSVIPHGDRSCVWMLLHAFFAAASSMLYNAAQNPASPNALLDLHLIRPFLSLLETLSKETRPCPRMEDLRQMHRTCSDLNNEAHNAVQLLNSRDLEVFV